MGAILLFRKMVTTSNQATKGLLDKYRIWFYNDEGLDQREDQICTNINWKEDKMGTAINPKEGKGGYKGPMVRESNRLYIRVFVIYINKKNI